MVLWFLNYKVTPRTQLSCQWCDPCTRLQIRRLNQFQCLKGKCGHGFLSRDRRRNGWSISVCIRRYMDQRQGRDSTPLRWLLLQVRSRCPQIHCRVLLSQAHRSYQICPSRAGCREISYVSVQSFLGTRRHCWRKNLFRNIHRRLLEWHIRQASISPPTRIE